MPQLPVMSGREVVRALETHGWQVARQRGSHVIMVKAGENATLSVPDHKEVAKGTLRSLILCKNFAPDLASSATSRWASFSETAAPSRVSLN
jgi:predicted RNA binding protein YcfA (HicA-like mRNA interferase family)